MHQPWRVPLILCMSVVFGAPVLSDMVQGPVALTTSGPRYLAALALAWVGVTAIARLIERFDLRNRLVAHDELLRSSAVDHESPSTASSDGRAAAPPARVS